MDWQTGLCCTATSVALYALYEWQKGQTLPDVSGIKSGGQQIAEVLKKNNVKHMFCLSGGHIAPVYVEANNCGIQVIDVRHEVNAVFAADAMARLTGTPGIAAVTAGPGVTNTITAVKNAQMAESPIIILGGATSIILKGRGSLQDIDHMAIMKPLVKWSASPRSVKEVVPALERAFVECQSGVPGPVFLELPMDLLWPPQTTLSQVEGMMPKGSSFSAKAIRWYIRRHLNTIFSGAMAIKVKEAAKSPHYKPSSSDVDRAFKTLSKAERPVIVMGSQSMICHEKLEETVEALVSLGIPVFTGGMARGVLGREGRGVLYRHNRSKALREADVVVLAGAVNDFRLQYGNAINPRAHTIVINRGSDNAYMNRRPSHAVISDVYLVILALAEKARDTWQGRWSTWHEVLRGRESEKEASITKNAAVVPEGDLLNPVHLCRTLNNYLDDNSIIVVDGGDFVGTASYILHPRQPLGWFDPGAFGTLGVGAGFAMACKVARPDSEVWIIYGDGALGFSIAEFDTFVRHKIGVIAVVGNDACWAQMIRDQVRLLKSDTACVLNRTEYHRVVEGFGARGLELRQTADIPAVVSEAKQTARQGIPVLINCHIARNTFREGAISI